MANWGSGMAAGCKPQIQLFTCKTWVMNSRIVLCDRSVIMPISCHFRHYQVRLVTIHVESAVVSYRTFAFTIVHSECIGCRDSGGPSGGAVAETATCCVNELLAKNQVPNSHTVS